MGGPELMHLQLGHVTNDNASANPCAAREVEQLLEKRQVLGDWSADEHDLG